MARQEPHEGVEDSFSDDDCGDVDENFTHDTKTTVPTTAPRNNEQKVLREVNAAATITAKVNLEEPMEKPGQIKAIPQPTAVPTTYNREAVVEEIEN